MTFWSLNSFGKYWYLPTSNSLLVFSKKSGKTLFECVVDQSNLSQAIEYQSHMTEDEQEIGLKSLMKYYFYCVQNYLFRKLSPKKKKQFKKVLKKWKRRVIER